jgi:hypothetical protein
LSSRFIRHLLRHSTHQHQINRLSNAINLNITDRRASIQHQFDGLIKPRQRI